MIWRLDVPFSWAEIAVGLGLAVLGLLAGLMIARRVPSIMSADGRRAWAFAAICGGAVVFTGFAGAGAWHLRDQPGFLFRLTIAAHGHILIAMTALGWALGRRLIVEATRAGAKISDQEDTKFEVTATAAVTPAAPPVDPKGGVE